MENTARQPIGQTKSTRNKVKRLIPGSATGDAPQYGSQPTLSSAISKDEAAGITSTIVPPFFPPHHHHPAMVPPAIPLPTPNISLPMPPLLPPPPLPQQFGPSPQQPNLGELLLSTNALPELIQKVHDLGFPGSCQFVLGLFERYFSSCFAGNDPMSTTSQIAQNNLLVLKDLFIFRQNIQLTGRPSSLLTSPPPLSPTEEMCMLMSLYNHLEELPTMELRCCVFDAVFSAAGVNNHMSGHIHHTPPTTTSTFNYLKKLVSLSINTESTTVLTCAALWIQAHPTDALLLVKSLYYDFCVLLSDAMEPLMGLATLVPYLANQMTIAFTSLYPFHLVGTDVDGPPGVDPTHLHPPIKLVHVISHWLESNPTYLYTMTPLNRNLTELPLIRTQSLTTPTISSHVTRSPLAGIVQWCILAPLSSHVEPQKARRHSMVQTKSELEVTVKENSIEKPDNYESENSDSLFAALHASLLSVIISRSSVTQGSNVALSRDDVAIIVAALLRFEQHTQSKWKKFVSSKMDECVERLAQFMQIGLSNGMVDLSQEDLTSVASTLPNNRLLDLVLAHYRQTGLNKS